MKWPNWVTTILILVTVVVWVAWDLVAFRLEAEGAATESVTLGTWFYKYSWVAVIMGGLTAHFIRSGPGTPPVSHLVLFVAAFAVGWYATALTRG